MTKSAELSHELDRLITQGHQDSSLLSVVLRKFPDTTQAEIETGLLAIGASRRLNKKDRLTPGEGT